MYAIILAFWYAHHIFWWWAPSITVFALQRLRILLEVYRNKALQVPLVSRIFNYTSKPIQ